MSKKSSDCADGRHGWRPDSGLREVFTTNEKRSLAGAVFRASDLNRVDFSGADLRNAEFRGVSLVGADFSDSDLRGASFFGCDLHEALFAGALFQLTRFDDSWLIGARGLSESMSEYVRRRGARIWIS